MLLTRERSVALERQSRILAPAPNSYFKAADGVLPDSMKVVARALLKYVYYV